MDTLGAPQIIEHISHSLNYTPFDVKWIPCSAKFVVVGQTASAKGIIQTYQMNEGKLELVTEVNVHNIVQQRYRIQMLLIWCKFIHIP